MKYELNNSGYKITVIVDDKTKAGTIHSDLKDTNGVDIRADEYNAAIDGLEALILAHACSGIDVASTQYAGGVYDAVDAITNHLA